MMPEGALRDLVAEGTIGGIAGSMVFLPQMSWMAWLRVALDWRELEPLQSTLVNDVDISLRR
jgi:hypothetical protein